VIIYFLRYFKCCAFFSIRSCSLIRLGAVPSRSIILGARTTRWTASFISSNYIVFCTHVSVRRAHGEYNKSGKYFIFMLQFRIDPSRINAMLCYRRYVRLAIKFILNLY